jgi:hypothetical protein
VRVEKGSSAAAVMTTGVLGVEGEAVADGEIFTSQR